MKHNSFLKTLAICLVVSGATILSFQNGLFDSWQEKIFDKFFISTKVTNEIVIFAVDNESISQVGQWPWPRPVFANAISKLQVAKSIGIDINFSEPSRTDPGGDFLLASAIANSKSRVILPVQINLDTKEKVEPLPMFQKGGTLGVVNFIVDEDGTVRRAVQEWDSLPSFASAAVSQLRPSLTIPDSLRIDYAGPAKTFLTLPISDLLNNKVPERFVEGRAVLIGATAPDLHDYFQTPLGLISGVEIHANIIDTLLSQNFYRDVSPSLAVATFLILNLTASILILKIKKFSLLALCLGLMLVGINTTTMMLFSWKIVFPVLYADLGFLAVSAVLVIFQYTVTSKEKKFIHDSFKYYLAPDVINELIANPEKLSLGGERRKVTILFSDIRGFTSMSETMTPEQLTRVLNEYLTEMTDIVMDSRGLVDKYIGDAVMAFWGAPIANESQAEDACRSAVRMLESLGQLNQHWKASGLAHQLNIGVGINTGDAVVGNMGSKKRFNYTLMGDEVNLTSRLEGLNKVYGTQILITESTQKEIENNQEFKIRELDSIIVKGKREPKLVFELVTGLVNQKILDNFKQGRELYKQGKWTKAIEIFSLESESDGPSKLYLERCKELMAHPPSDWNGVYEFKTK